MGLFDKLKDMSKKAGTKIKEEASKELARIKDKKEAMKMLQILRKSELTKFCSEYGIEYDNAMNKSQFIEQIDVYGGRQISTELVTDYFHSIRRKVPTKFIKEIIEDDELEQEIVRTEEIKTEKVTTIETKTIKTKSITKLRSHLKDFDPIVIGSFKEKNLEAQMVQSLRRDFGKNKVSYQERARGGRIDIVVDGKYAIELKVISSPSQLTQLVGQVSNYSREYQKVFLYLFYRKSQMKNKDLNVLKQNIKHLKNVEILIKN